MGNFSGGGLAKTDLFAVLGQPCTASADTCFTMGIDEIISLRLERGISQLRGFTLGSNCPRALFRVGTAIECNWRVQGPGVAPHHVMLLWKAGVLTLVDVGAGGVYVDGEAFSLSRTIACGRIVFASAAICVERLPKREMPACSNTAGILLSKTKA